ncbi:MAG TPA: glycosyltransferase family 39 protein [Candidatus Baltobacteraceae bacterium]|nr:glycosyltransferase family 39 protein [Candidatus Baltobacteraceae bacterium]
MTATPSTLWWGAGLVFVVAIALALRLKGIHDPILDHPGWRQGDTASIARNFFRLQYNIMYPQTTYNGAPPNYVELELQIVPFMAATLYKLFGLHEVFGRLISIAFSVATVVVVGFFGRWLFTSSLAGLIGAFFFAVYPGSAYYGRTFTPDTAMVFFLTAALYAVTRFLLENERMEPRPLARVTALLTFAYLAKPVAVAGFIPVLCAVWDRVRSGLNTRVTALGVLLIVPLLILWLYDQRVASYAEWHWASGITRLHVLPSLQASLTGAPAFLEKCTEFRVALGMFRDTMLGSAGFWLAVASFVALPWIAARSRPMLWGWLAAGLIYVFVVVTVERVDYYMLLLVPLCALTTGGALAFYVRSITAMSLAVAARYALTAIVPVLGAVVLFQGVAAAAPYYGYNKSAYRNAVALDRTLDRNVLVVIGHYGPDVQYYIDRFGWEEDPALWTPFDEQSAIRKGSRYFISIEDNRLRRNIELCAWLQRFPVLNPAADWPVYVTDPAKMLPKAETFWRAFRAAERAGRGRAFLDAHGVCEVASVTRR